MPQRNRRGLATWLTSSKTPLFVLDASRDVLVFNQGCEELTQWEAASVIGKTCHFQSEPNPDQIASLTGALCPPQIPTADHPVRRRVQLQRRDLTIVERDIYFFLLAEGEETSGHIMGIITECSDSPGEEIPGRQNLDASRHINRLYSRYRIDRLVAVTPAMQRVAAQIELARQQHTCIHIVGMKGVGKEHIARLIHYGSEHKAKRIIPIRCATASHYELSQIFSRLSENNATSSVGTLYLDEVSLLPGDLQPAVVQLIQQNRFRWISSSASGLDGLPEESFHPLLHFLLTPLIIRVPSLHQRNADIPLLAQQLLEECNLGEVLQHTEFAPAVLRQFQQYTWPGNVDELAQVVQKACERSQTLVVEATDLPPEFNASLQSRAIRPPAHPVSLEAQLAQFERVRIREALESARGNKALAAERLGIPRAKLYRRMESLGLDDHDSPVAEKDSSES